MLEDRKKFVFHIKICGVRCSGDVDAVGESHADAVGLNFFPPSVRYVDPLDPKTEELSRRAEMLQLARVGVFVNDSAAAISDIVANVGLDHVQLHGDEPVGLAESLAAQGIPVIRAIKLPADGLDWQLIADLATPWIDAGCRLLIDADSGAAHGGGGRTLDWGPLAEWSRRYPEACWTLAGGLTVENVAQAISESGANSVDVASGVEQPRGQKDPKLIVQFARNANDSFSRQA